MLCNAFGLYRKKKKNLVVFLNFKKNEKHFKTKSKVEKKNLN